MVTLAAFSLLTLSQRAQYLWERGTFILCRPCEQGFLSLYALDGFFAELYYEAQANRIIDVLGFVQLDRLQTHTEAISLEELG